MSQNTGYDLSRIARGYQVVDPILDELMHELKGFAALLREYGRDLAIDSPNALIAWAGLDLDARQNILKNFSAYYANCLEMHAAGVSLRDNHAFVAHHLKKANLFAKDEIDTLMTNDYMVEVYNLNEIQIFRSINFFDYCNYSLLDLLAREWMALYDRLSSVTASLFREVHEAMAARELRPFVTPAHVMKEKDANPCGVFLTEFLYCCPLYSAPGVPAGYLILVDVTELDLEAADEKKFTFLR